MEQAHPGANSDDPHIVTEIQYKTGFEYAKENINFIEEKFKGFYGSPVDV